MTSHTRPRKAASASAGAEPGVRPAVLIPLALLVVACLAVCGVLWTRSRAPKPALAPEPQAREESQTITQVVAVASAPMADRSPAQATNPPLATVPTGKAPTSQPVSSAVPRPEASPYTRQLVNGLVNLEQAGVPRTPEQVAAWKQGLQQLVQQGSAALPAIREFLERNTDVSFGSDGAHDLGYSSARAAMYDALAQIGGADAAGVMLDTLRTTTSPQDIALLARSLEQMAPDQYRPQILEAARQMLTLPLDGQGTQTDVAPLFDVLAKYGGPNAIADLGESASRWKYYSAIALGQMPDSAGVPSLIQMVQDPSGGAVKNIPALEVLTQLAAENAEARAALLQAVRANAITPNTWAYLAAGLSGDQIHYLDATSGGMPSASSGNDIRTFHIASGNQNFYMAPPVGGLTADQINQQMGLIDQLLGATSEPTAQQTLQNARDTLLRRSSLPPSTAPRL